MYIHINIDKHLFIIPPQPLRGVPLAHAHGVVAVAQAAVRLAALRDHEEAALRGDDAAGDGDDAAAHLGAKDCTPESNTSEIVVDFKWHFPTLLSWFSGIVHRIVTFPVDCHWNCPMDFLWHFPMDSLL